MRKLSKKNEDKLYGTIHEDIMKARIKTMKALKGVVHPAIVNEVDNILADLMDKAPMNALDLFNDGTQ